MTYIPKTLYRFRSIERLLNNDELKNHYFYFSDPCHLNDPLEGFKQITWKGKYHDWSNFIENYIYCYTHALIKMHIPDHNYLLTENDIQPSLWPKYKSPLVHDIVKASYINFIEEIDKSFGYNEFIKNHLENNELNKSKILYLLNAITMLVNYCITKEMVRNKLINKEFDKAVTLNSALSSIEHFIGLNIAHSKEPEHKFMQAFLSSAIGMEQQTRHWSKQATPTTVKNLRFMYTGIQECYIQKLNELTIPLWKTACFMSNHKNVSNWSQYADNHKGICLEFNIDNGGIKLKDDISTEFKEYKLYKVNYHKNLVNLSDKINFFKHLGQLNHRSACAWLHEEFNDENYQDFQESETSWNKKITDSLIQLTTKKHDNWKHESEYRILLSKNLQPDVNINLNKYTYDPSHLKRIIFGIKTEWNEKLRIISLIQNTPDLKHVQISQAYYDENENIIKHLLLKLNNI